MIKKLFTVFVFLFFSMNCHAADVLGDFGNSGTSEIGWVVLIIMGLVVVGCISLGIIQERKQRKKKQQ